MTRFCDTAAYRDPDRLYRDFVRFHAAAVDTRDVDPVYPVYRAMASTLELTRPQRAWLVFCHVAYYHMGSALAAYAATGHALEAGMAPLNAPVGTERRAHWTRTRLARHLAALERAARPFGGDLDAWARADLPPSPTQAWEELTGRLQKLDGNGRWAAFKTAEMLQQICGVPVAAPDMGHAYSSGPRHGLDLLHPGLPAGNSPRTVRVLDQYSAELVARLLNAGIPATLETTETALCDFHSMWKGGYYVGHDIDAMQRQLAQLPSPLTQAALHARASALPTHYLGELGGWLEPDRERRRHYRATGEVILR